jgi:hypothetical protein
MKCCNSDGGHILVLWFCVCVQCGTPVRMCHTAQHCIIPEETIAALKTSYLTDRQTFSDSECSIYYVSLQWRPSVQLTDGHHDAQGQVSNPQPPAIQPDRAVNALLPAQYSRTAFTPYDGTWIYSYMYWAQNKFQNFIQSKQNWDIQNS